MVEEIIQAIYPIPQHSSRKITSLIEVECYNTGHNFVSVDKKNDKEYFLLEGVCGSYLANSDGLDNFISFFTSKSVLSPHTTRTSKRLSLLNIKSLTPVKLASLNAQKFEELMIQDQEIREFGNTVLRNELRQKVGKEIGLASLTAKERLIQFRKKYPSLENLIPHPFIASYLGITNVSLSRLRKELMK